MEDIHFFEDDKPHDECGVVGVYAPGREVARLAFAYRHRIGRPVNYPNSDLSYTENFLYMLDYMGQHNYTVNPVLAKALDVLFADDGSLDEAEEESGAEDGVDASGNHSES